MDMFITLSSGWYSFLGKNDVLKSSDHSDQPPLPPMVISANLANHWQASMESTALFDNILGVHKKNSKCAVCNS